MAKKKVRKKSLIREGWTEKKWGIHWKQKYFGKTIKILIFPNLYSRREAKDDVRIRIAIKEL